MGRKTLAERFWEKVDKSGDCWLWTGTKNDRGYGKFCVGNAIRPAHRISYELIVGEIPNGLQLDHLCRVRHCVNPKHLEPVTRKDNILRGICPTAINAAKTHCNYGHEFDKGNTYLELSKINGSISRHCRKCGARRFRERYIPARNSRGSQP